MYTEHLCSFSNYQNKGTHFQSADLRQTVKYVMRNLAIF